MSGTARSCKSRHKQDLFDANAILEYFELKPDFWRWEIFWRVEGNWRRVEKKRRWGGARCSLYDHHDDGDDDEDDNDDVDDEDEDDDNINISCDDNDDWQI